MKHTFLYVVFIGAKLLATEKNQHKEDPFGIGLSGMAKTID